MRKLCLLCSAAFLLAFVGIASADEPAAPKPDAPAPSTNADAKVTKTVDKDGTTKEVTYDADGKTVRSEKLTRKDQAKPYSVKTFKGGKLLSELSTNDKGDTTTTVYETVTGHKVFEIVDYKAGSRSSSLFRTNNGKLWARTTTSSCLPGHIESDFYATDGNRVRRVFSGSDMTVILFNPKDAAQYTQKWTVDAKGLYVLKSVEFPTKNGHRLVVMKADGKTIDRVEYYEYGKTGPVLKKTEQPNNLSDPVNPASLQKLYPVDDPTAPTLQNLGPVK